MGLTMVRTSVLLGSLVAARMLGEQGASDSGVVLRSSTTLVQVRVIAENSKGAVTDLRREDFEVLSDRKPQPLTLFTIESGAEPRAAQSDSAKPSSDARTDPGYALLVLDWLNTDPVDRIMAQDNLVALLKKFEPRQRVGLYLPSTKPRLLLDFTTDRDLLLDAIQAAGEEPIEAGDDPAPGQFDARYGGKSGPPNIEMQLFFWNKKVVDTLHTFEAIAEHLAHVPGRKSLIWVSAGFPMVVDGTVVPGAKAGEIVYGHDLDRMLSKLNASDVAVYSVDPRGLKATGSRGFTGTLQELASRTGGTAFYDRNDLDEGIRLAFEDTRLVYVLGFHVPEGVAPGIHDIRVRVKRPGVKLRYRDTYSR